MPVPDQRLGDNQWPCPLDIFLIIVSKNRSPQFVCLNRNHVNSGNWMTGVGSVDSRMRINSSMRWKLRRFLPLSMKSENSDVVTAKVLSTGSYKAAAVNN